LELELLLQSSSSNVRLTQSRPRPTDERVPNMTRTNLAGRPVNRVRGWYRLRRLRSFLQPCQDTWYPNSPGFRTTKAIERRLLLQEATALVVWCGHDLVLERRHDWHHNILQICSPRPLTRLRVVRLFLLPLRRGQLVWFDGYDSIRSSLLVSPWQVTLRFPEREAFIQHNCS